MLDPKRELWGTDVLKVPVLGDDTLLPELYIQGVRHVFIGVGSVGDMLPRRRLYETEAQADPLPRGPSAIRALARYRGATIGVEFAEAFMLIRQLM